MARWLDFCLLFSCLLASAGVWAVRTEVAARLEENGVCACVAELDDKSGEGHRPGEEPPPPPPRDIEALTNLVNELKRQVEALTRRVDENSKS